MISSRSPRKVLFTAYRLARKTLPDHACRCSRHDFTLAQLFACLVLREFYGLSSESDGTTIAAWQFFGQRTVTVTLGNGVVTSYMNNAQTRSAIQSGQSTPAWGDVTTDHLGYDGSGRLIGKRHFNGGAVLVGNTTTYDESGNKLYERALHAENRSHLYDAYDWMDRLLEYQRGTLAGGGSTVTTPITLPGTNQQQAYDLGAGRAPGVGRTPSIRVVGWCVMSNHWHLVLWPGKDGELTSF